MPRDPEGFRIVEEIVAKAIADEGLHLLGWREVPVDNARPRREREGDRAAAPADLRRQGQGHGRPGGLRAPPVPRPQGDLERRLRPQGPAHRRLLPGLPVLAHDRLQGHGAGAPSSATTTRTCRTRASRARSPSSTSASRPTPSRPGSSPIPTGWSPITARSTRCAATSTGWRRARPRVDSELFGNDISKLWPISYEGQSDTACFDNALEFLVRGGYPLAHAMMMLIPEAWAGNPLMDRGPARLLRVPRRPDGAVGRPGRDLLHGRAPDRRDPRPQRPAPGALSRHRRRARGARLRDGRAADPGGDDRREVAAAAGQDAAHRPRAGPHRLRRRDQARSSRPPIPTRTGSSAPRSCSRT